jgi:hypothetical protein
MREPKITLAYIRGWDHFDMDRYSNYLKALNYVESTLSSIHARSVEDNQQNRRSRLTESSMDKSRPLAEINH